MVSGCFIYNLEVGKAVRSLLPFACQELYLSGQLEVELTPQAR